MIDAEPLQRIAEKILHRDRPAVHAGKTAGGVAQRAELDTDLKVVAAAAGERVADQQLIVADAIEIAGVEQRDPRIERGMDGGNALAAVGGAVKIRHAHTAETDGGDVWAGGAQFAMFHGGSPRKRPADDPRAVVTRLILGHLIETISWTMSNSLFTISNNAGLRSPRSRCLCVCGAHPQFPACGAGAARFGIEPEPAVARHGRAARAPAGETAPPQ